MNTGEIFTGKQKNLNFSEEETENNSSARNTRYSGTVKKKIRYLVFFS